jgi:hypothetical protein
MNKTVKILWWVIALLVMLNLTTIGTILFRNRESSDDNIAIVLDENRQNPLTGRFFRQTLGFDDAQMNIFREAHRSFQYRANDLIFGMDSLKNELFTELNSPTPDTLPLFRDGTMNRGRGYQWNDSTGTGQGNRHRYGRRGSGE